MLFCVCFFAKVFLPLFSHPTPQNLSTLGTLRHGGRARATRLAARHQHVAGVLLALARVCPRAAVLRRVGAPFDRAHSFPLRLVKVGDVDPLGGGPLVAGEHGAGAVQGGVVALAFGAGGVERGVVSVLFCAAPLNTPTPTHTLPTHSLQRKEQQRIPFDRLERHALVRALAVFGPHRARQPTREHCLPPLLRGGQVHEHGG